MGPKNNNFSGHPPGTSAAADAQANTGSDGSAPHVQLDQWVHEYSGDLKRFLAKRRFIESDIKDVCQEVYLRLMRFERPEVIQNPRAYLFRIAANVAHDFRLRRPQWDPLETSKFEESSEPGPEQVADETRLMKIVASLPALPRAVIALKHQEGLSYTQISERLGVSPRRVKRAVALGYAQVRHALQEDVP